MSIAEWLVLIWFGGVILAAMGYLAVYGARKFLDWLFYSK